MSKPIFGLDEVRRVGPIVLFGVVVEKNIGFRSLLNNFKLIF